MKEERKTREGRKTREEMQNKDMTRREGNKEGWKPRTWEGKDELHRREHE